MNRLVRFSFPALMACSLALVSPAVQAAPSTQAPFQLAQAKEPLEPIGGQYGGTSYGDPGTSRGMSDYSEQSAVADENDNETQNPGMLTAIMLATLLLALAGGMFVMHRFNHTEDMRPM